MKPSESIDKLMERIGALKNKTAGNLSVSGSSIRDPRDEVLRQEIQNIRLHLFEFAVSHTLNELLIRTLDEVEALTKSKIGFYHFLDSDQKTLALQAWSTRTIKSFCHTKGDGMHYPVNQAGVWVDCIRKGKPVIHNDYEALSHKKGLPEGHAPVDRELVVPVFRQGKIVAILGVGNKATDYDQIDVETISYLADVCWVIVEKKRGEEEIKKITRDLKERVKELDCMFAISRMIENPDLSKKELLQAVVQRLSAAFQYPANTYVRLSFDGKVYTTKNFIESDLKLSAALVVDGLAEGSLEVFLPGGSEEYSFLAEERNMIEEVALSISRYLNRRRIQKLLKKSSEKLRITLDSIGDAVITTDLEKRITGLNPVAEELTGWTLEEAAGKPLEKVFNIVNAHNGERAENPVKMVLEKGKIVGLANHTKLISRSGVAYQIADSAAPIRTDSGDVEGVVMVFRDITERYRMQEELAQREKHLRKAQQIGKTGSWLFHMESGKIDISEESCRIYGLDKTREHTIEEIQEFPLPEYRQMLDEALQKLINGEEKYDIEFKIKRPSDGRILIIHSIAEYNQKEKIVTGFIQDISEIKKLMQELVIAKEKAEVSERLKSAFLANMSHEIRTPMNGILGFTDLLKKPELNSEMKDQYINIIHASGLRMLNTVNDIIEFSRIEAGSVHLENDKTNVHQKIEDHILFFSHEAEVKGLSLIFDNGYSPDGCEIFTDQARLNSILTNLIKNAIKFTKAGEIHVGYRKKDEWYEFYVKDTGVGIPKERQEAVFNRFEQADNSETRPYEGSGLGLSIAKSYVEMQGGKMWLESEVDRGSVFYFSLPLSS